MNTVHLNIRLVPRDFAAVTDPRRIPARTVPFVWSESERLWRSVEPLFVSAAKREGDGAYRAVGELADGPFYHTALRIKGQESDSAATLQSRLDGEQLMLVAPQRWACLDCQRGFKKEKDAGPCARHQKEMPPAVLYKTTHPRVNRLGQYYVFGWARDFESTTPIAKHNDEIWNPSLEQADVEREALRASERLAAEQLAQERAAYDALSPDERQAAFERALFGEAAAGAATDAEGDGLASYSCLMTKKGSLVVQNGAIWRETGESEDWKTEPDRIKSKNPETLRQVAEAYLDGPYTPTQLVKKLVSTSLSDGEYPYIMIARIQVFIEDTVGPQTDIFADLVKMEFEVIACGPASGVDPEFAQEVTRICNILRVEFATGFANDFDTDPTLGVIRDGSDRVTVRRLS